MDRELAYVNTDFFLKPSYNYSGLQLAFFSYFRLNFVANYDVMNVTTQSSKHDLACISLLSKIMISVTYATYPPLLNIDSSVL